MIPLLTERLILRAWRPEDKPPFAALNGDPEVMRYFPATLGREQSDALAEQFAAELARDGMTFFAVEEQAMGRFIGVIGLRRLPGRLPIAPGVEIGWRLAAEAWGRGYATEGARAALRWAFETLTLPEVLAYTAAGNAASRRVMEKIGMVRWTEADFAHPELPARHRLSRHVVYRAIRADGRPLSG